MQFWGLCRGLTQTSALSQLQTAGYQTDLKPAVCRRKHKRFSVDGHSDYALGMSESHLRCMPPIAGENLTGYRLLVHASKHSSKSFGWTILQEDNDHVPVMQSLVTFRSLADAHAAGIVALRKFRTHQALSANRARL
jgi:hypothetical protein